ncbi:MAG: hypothetical protein PHT51_00230 [Patescibacteria group bacterium]|nr:hypothetical protein [Patescibacteria group bacterium]MDD4610661.1 hypothetical protein [Patescibacteria group bacterium]
MDRQTLEEMAKRHYFLQPLRITFVGGEDGLETLNLLNLMQNNGLVRFDNSALVAAILLSRRWEGNGKLGMTFPTGAAWSNGNFLFSAERGIKDIEIISASSPLNALQTRRQKMREEAFKEISAGILPKSLRTEIESYGLTVEIILETSKSGRFHAIVLTVRNGKDIAFSFNFDGWSGVIRDRPWRVLSFCSTLQTAEFWIRKAFVVYLEVETM